MVDLRSDTVTQPTEAMRKAMYEAKVGDDGYRDDPTLTKLEKMAATVVGKEAAMFVVSGVMGNQVALFTHCQQGDQVILPDDCHIVLHENGGAACIAGVNLHTMEAPNGFFDLNRLEKALRPREWHPHSKLICLENPYGSGVVQPLDYMEKIAQLAKQNHTKIHLDGARLFNAATYLNVHPKEITKHVDSVMFCLSKGLAAPVGSMVAGSKEFITRARVKRRIMGGDLRQAGVLAAAGIIAIKEMTKRLGEDHENASYFANEIAKVQGVKVNVENVHINMVFVDFNHFNLDDRRFVNYMLERGLDINPPEFGEYRFVFHNDVDRNDATYAVKCIRDYLYQ